MKGKTKMANIIEVKPIEIDTVQITIVEKTPLIVHAWDEKSKRMMLEKQMGKAKKGAKENKIPVNDFINSLYWLTEKPKDGADNEEAKANYNAAINAGAKFGFSLGGIKKSFAAGAFRTGITKDKVSALGTMYLKAATEAGNNDYAEIIFDDLVMREDMVRVGNGVADIRYRGEFRGWRIPLLLEYNKNGAYSIEQIISFINAGGFACGIGEWRPEKGGQMGMYYLETV